MDTIRRSKAFQEEEMRMVRPGGVTAISIFWFVLGGLCACFGILAMVGGGFIATMLNQPGQAGSSGLAGILAGLGAALGILFLLFAASYIVMALGLWKLKEWARIVGVVLTGIAVLLQLPGLFSTLTHFSPGRLLWSVLWIAVDCLIIVYLVKPEVKAAFQAPQVRAASA
ncbi:MAG TPA: DUF2127 domain-containing protein [Candidatus Angelobacter sp.]